MSRYLNFETDGADWPNRDASRIVPAAGLRWHVQEMGANAAAAPTALLLHGTGASTHSWRDLMPELAKRFHVIAPDLPGHGFTVEPALSQLSLPGMALATAKLMETLGAEPDLIVGHSAGAAIGARMCLDGAVRPKGLVSLAGALLPLRGAPGKLFSPTAKLLAMNPLVPRIFAWRARKAEVISELLGRTGSTIDAEGLRCYSVLARSAGHAGAALGMMANWDLRGLARELPKLSPALLLFSAARDGMIPVADAERAHQLVPGSTLVRLDGLGHLAHEEDPAAVAATIDTFCKGLAL